MLIRLKCALASAGIAVLIMFSWLLWECIKVVRVVPEIVRQESQGLQNRTVGEVESLKRSLQQEIQLARKDAVTVADGYKLMLSERFTDTNKILESTTAEVTRQTGTVISPLGQTLVNTEELTRLAKTDLLEAGERLEPWTSCKGNGTCVQAQFTAALGAARATLGETARTMRVVRENTPAVADSVVESSKSFSSIAKNVDAKVAELTKPKPWYKKIWSVGKVALDVLF